MGTLLIKALNGGIIVCVFAALAEAAKPKRFAGLFAAAPAIALGSLTVDAVVHGSEHVALAALGMVVSSVGFLAFVVVNSPAIKFVGALKGSLLAIGAWIGVVGAGYWVFLR